MLSCRPMLLILGSVLVLALTACNHSMRSSLVGANLRPRGPADPSPVLNRLLASMEGSFSSADQHSSDPENYFDIRLEMKRIWPERTDGIWLYVEQAAAENLSKPYRQRVYCLLDNHDGSLTSAVYSLPGDPLKWVGAYREANPLAEMQPSDLSLRKGCAIRLRESGDSFVGSTVGDACASTLRGAAYATSEVTVSSRELTSWDRGFDAQNQQVWGAELGPYVFKKLR